MSILAQDPITLWSIVTWLGTTVAISIGMYYLGQALFGQDLREAEPREDARSRMWDPHTTQSEGLSQARCYGRNMHLGNIVGKWTDVDGDEREILYLILEHGDGPTKGNVANMLWLNDQPAGNFGSVEVQERIGTMDQTCMTGFEKSKLEYTPNVELKKADEGDPYIWTSPNKFFNDIEYTICFPDGLMKYRENGATTDWTVHLRARCRVHPDGGWITLFDGDITRQRTKPLFLKYSVNTQVPGTVVYGKQYDLELQRTTVDGHVRRLDKSFLRSVREIVDVPFTRPGKALTGIKAIATTQLSGRLDVKIIREDRLVNTFNGTTWEIKYTRNRSWIEYDIFTQPVIIGNGDSEPWSIAYYEGTHPANMDLAFFYAWANFCGDQVLDGYGGTEDRLACDIKVDYQTNVWDLVHDIAEIGRAKIWSVGSKITGWIDKAVDTQNLDLVTMDNTMARSWKNHWANEDELAGVVEVWYHDRRQGYERVPVPYPKPAAGKHSRTVSIEGIGITTYGTAVHVANHALTRNELIKNINNFQQHKDAFRHKLGDVIRVQNNIPDWGEGYRVVDTPSNNTCELDRHCALSAGNIIYIQSYDETAKEVVTKSYTVESVTGNVLTIEETWTVPPAKNNVVAIGQVVLRRIVKMEPLVTNYFDITVETYDAVLYDADNLDPDAPYKDYIWLQPPGTLAKPISHDDVVDLIDLMLPPQPDIEIPWLTNIEWSGDEVDTIYWDKRDADEEIVFRYRGVDYEITANPTTGTTDKFIYWDPDFSTEFKTTNLVTVATAAGNWYMCRNVDGIAYPANSMMVAHIGVLLAGFLKVGTADIDDLAVETLKIKDQAVTLMVAAYTASQGYYEDYSWHEAQTITMVTTGAPVALWAAVQWKNVGDYGCNIRIQRDDSVTFYSTNMFSAGQLGNPFCVSIVDEPNAGEHTYDLDIATTNVDIGDPKIWYKNRSLVAQEVKK